VHDESFSKEDVVFNQNLLAPNGWRVGQLMAIVPVHESREREGIGANNARDFGSMGTGMGKRGEGLGASLLEGGLGERGGKAAEREREREEEEVERRYLFALKETPREMLARHSNLEISVTKHVADVFGFKHRSTVLVSTTTASVASASHIEMSFRDEYLARSDMWRLTLAVLSNKTVYKGQKIVFMGTIKAQVTSVYVAGRKVHSAFFSSNTKPIFRSESARYVLFIQMSKEMWDFDSEGSGEIMFTKVVNGFLPALFKRWVALKARHLVTIVLFTRVEYDTGLASKMDADANLNTYYTGIRSDGSRKPYKDFYRVVVSEMASNEWTTILYQLKQEFRTFRRDVSMFRLNTMAKMIAPTPGEFSMGSVPGTRIEAEPTFAIHGNVLEAIDLAASQFSQDHIDRDLLRTGISVVVITPGPGLFEVDYQKLRATTEALIGSGIGIDLVCLPKIPLHSVPLFRYRNPQFVEYQERMRMKAIGSESSTPRQIGTVFGSFSTLQESLSPSKPSSTELQHRLALLASKKAPEEWSYAIPHWLDVSFWTGAAQELLSQPGAEIANKSTHQKGCIKPRKQFQVRCKMYEIEMLGNVENTEITVGQLPDHIRRLGNTDGSNGLGLLKEKRKHSALSEPIFGPIRPVLDKKSTAAEREFFDSLDTFDEKAAVVSTPLLKSSSKVDLRKHAKLMQESSTKRILADDPKVFGTSWKDGDDRPKGLNLAMNAMSIRKKSEGRLAIDPKGRKESVTSIPPQTPALPSRLGKINRQISLGFRGFGIAAPKAAVAEVHTEHASASKLPSKSQTSSAQSSSTAMANHLLGSPRTDKGNDRPPSAQGSMRSAKDRFMESVQGDEVEKSTSRPITIKTVASTPEPVTSQTLGRSILGSLYEGIDINLESLDMPSIQKLQSNDTMRTSKSKLLAGDVPDVSTLSPTSTVSPWLNVLNPSNPTIEDNNASQYKRWQHVFPRPIVTQAMKWKSLCSPASVPLTTEYFPTKLQLDTEYQQKPYNISQNVEDDLLEVPKSREEFLRELINLRLSQGFQIVVGPAVAEAFGQKVLKIANAFDCEQIAEDGTSIFLSMGNIIHQLSCVNGTEVEVNMFQRKSSITVEPPTNEVLSGYKPAIRTHFDETYESREVVLRKPVQEYNWNYVDSFIAGHDDEMSDILRYWRARFVLIPVERFSSMYHTKGEDTEEEIRLEGIRTLTQMWQKHRYIPPSERRFQSLSDRKRRDPNPLDIWYQTQDPSIVVAAELETLPLLETGEAQIRRGQLLSEGERFRKTNLNIATLADAIQQPVEKGGVRMQNRRWHFRLHYNCFIGSDMTTWLIENFEDVETREKAVELGNMLMAKDDVERRAREREQMKDGTKEKEKDKDVGIFVHVEKRHPFRDGQYFYQVVGENAKPRPETRAGWPFGARRRDTSVPSTPMSDNPPRDSPKTEHQRSSSNADEKDNSTDSATPATSASTRRPKIALSNVMKYDVDPRKRSYRPERINLHYDRIHNPDNCYHIRLDWMNVTAKLIEDAIASWAVTADRYGLRLVEAPIAEACCITQRHPFRAPYHIHLAVPPPDSQPPTEFDTTSLVPVAINIKHYYQKAIMKKFNFVLDTEAASNFPSSVEVVYSWGVPDYKLSQYIHRSGMVFAQITEDGDFLLVSNKMFNNRNPAGRDGGERFINPTEKPAQAQGPTKQHLIYSAANSPLLRAALGSPQLRPSDFRQGQTPTSTTSNANLATNSTASIATTSRITLEIIKNDLESFCASPTTLKAFYTEVLEKPPLAPVIPAVSSPFIRGSYSTLPGMSRDADVPMLGLGPGLLSGDFARDGVASWRDVWRERENQGPSYTGTYMGPRVMSFPHAPGPPVRKGSACLSDGGSLVGIGSPRNGPSGMSD
jgi:hypothetical protein